MGHPRTTRIWRIARCCVVAGAITLAHLVTAAPSDGTPLPVLMFPRFVVTPLADAGVRVPVDKYIAATRAYLDAYEVCLLHIDEEFTRIDPQFTRAASGENFQFERPFLSVDQVRRLSQCDARAYSADNSLRQTLYDAFAAAARPEDKLVIEACMSVTAVQQAQQRFQGSFATQRYLAPDDIGGALAWSSRDPETTPDERRNLIVLCGQQATQRADSFRAAQQFLQAREAENALKAEQLGIVGVANVPYYQAKDLRLEPEATGAGTDPWKRMVSAQLATYRAIEPQLPPRARARLRSLWIPRMLGIQGVPKGVPRAGVQMSGSGIPDLVVSLLQRPELDDMARERIRTVGRAWIADDNAIVDGAFAKMCETGVPLDPSEERATRAARATAELKTLDKLDWIGTPTPPSGDPLALSEADEKEFGKPPPVHGTRVTPDGDPDVEAAQAGLPSGYPPAQCEDMLRQLGLHGDERQIALTLLNDARDKWMKEMLPRLRASALEPRHPSGLQTVELITGWAAKSRAALEAREAIWRDASAFDDAVFDALRSSVGNHCAPNVLEALRASRRARRLVMVSFDSVSRAASEAGPTDVAALLLGEALTEAGRARALAVAAPHWGSYANAIALVEKTKFDLRMSELERDVTSVFPRWTAEQRADREQIAKVSAERAKVVEEAAQRTRAASDRADAACISLAAAAVSIVATVIETQAPRDTERLTMAANAMRYPRSYQDLRPLWRAVDQALACVPDTERDAVAARLSKICTEIAERNDRLGKYMVEANPDRERAQVFGSYSSACTEFGFVELAAAVPSQCRGPFKTERMQKTIANLEQMAAGP